MNIFILNERFESILLVEMIQSFIWNDRFNEAGDFELYIPAKAYDMSLFKIGYYVMTILSDRLMIIEKVICETGAEDGDFITVSGRSIESILSRRVIIEQTDISGPLQDGIETLLNQNVIAPEDPKRTIPGFVFRKSSDQRILNITIDVQYEGGENLYDSIRELLSTNKVGMRVVRDSSNTFIFELYLGVDRSHAQKIVPWVVFSPEFENLITSEYTESIMDYKNQIIVVGSYDEKPEEQVPGEDISAPIEQKEPKEIRVEIGDHSGLDRFEHYEDARDITSRIINEDSSSNPGEETEDEYLTEEEFTNKLIERGNKALDEYKKEITFDAEVDYTQNFIMGRDYFLGDILQVSNSYGMSCSLRVNEYIISISASGEEHYPKFVNPEKEDTTV